MAKIKSGIKVSAPATISNLGSSTGTMALALTQMSDEIVVKQIDQAGVHLKQITGDKNKLSLDIEENTAGYAALKTWEHLLAEGLIDPKVGLSLELRKKIPIGSGLGSSAASAVAGAMAVNEFFGRPLEQKALLPFAAMGEKLSATNTSLSSVGASLWGGWVLMRDNKSLDLHRLPLLRGLHIAVILPKKAILSRDILDQLKDRKVNFDTAQQQSANTAALVLGLYNTNFELIKRSMKDHLSDQKLTQNTPYFGELQDIALDAGALSSNISGTGPAFFAFCNNSLKAEAALSNMKKLYDSNKIKYTAFVSEVNLEGAKIQ